MPKLENKTAPLAIFLAYNKLIKEYHDKFGEIASHVDKGYMYTQVAREFSITPKYAGQLIRRVLAHRGEFSGYEVEAREYMEFIHGIRKSMKKFV